ncbi:MAG: hypothetical protein AB7F32_08950 [Victivallaceae bacterium]
MIRKILPGLCLCCIWLTPAAPAAEYTVRLLAHVNEDIELPGGKETLTAGIYVDRFRFTVDPPGVECAYERKLFTPLTGAPDYQKQIDMQKIFAWGNYDADFALNSLNFISLENDLRVHRIDSANLRGISKADGNLLLFLTSRNPPRLEAYNMDDQTIRTVKVADFIDCAENVGIKIGPDGTVKFTGTGFQEYSPHFRVPEAFVRDDLKDCEGVWLLLLNRRHSVVFSSTQKAERRVVIWDRDSDRWRYFELDRAYIDTRIFKNYLVFQTEADDASSKLACVFNLENDELTEFKLPPFTKVLYYSKSYAVLAQPYRLLLATRSADNLNILKTIDYPLAWYVRMAAKE